MHEKKDGSSYVRREPEELVRRILSQSAVARVGRAESGSLVQRRRRIASEDMVTSVTEAR